MHNLFSPLKEKMSDYRKSECAEFKSKL